MKFYCHWLYSGMSIVKKMSTLVHMNCSPRLSGKLYHLIYDLLDFFKGAVLTIFFSCVCYHCVVFIIVSFLLCWDAHNVRCILAKTGSCLFVFFLSFLFNLFLVYGIFDYYLYFGTDHRIYCILFCWQGKSRKDLNSLKPYTLPTITYNHYQAWQLLNGQRSLCYSKGSNHSVKTLNSCFYLYM